MKGAPKYGHRSRPHIRSQTEIPSFVLQADTQNLNEDMKMLSLAA